MANPKPTSRTGRPNKATQSIKEMIEAALQAKGGQAWLEEQMELNPAAMMTLIGKILPRQVDVKADVESKSVIIMASQQDIDL